MGSVMAALGIPMLLGPIGGPILGGFLDEQLSWHWIFLSLPIGIIASSTPGSSSTRTTSRRARTSMFSASCLSPWSGAGFLFGLSGRRREGTFASTRVLVPAGIDLVLIVAFVVRATHRRCRCSTCACSPMLPAQRALITMSMFAIAFFGSTLLFLQYFIGCRVRGTMMWTAAGTADIRCDGNDAGLGRLTDKMGPGKFVLIRHHALIFAGLTPLMFLGADTSYFGYDRGALFIAGSLGMGMTLTPIMTSALQPEAAPHRRPPRFDPLLNVAADLRHRKRATLFSVLLATNLSSHKGSGSPSSTASGDYAARRQGRPAATTAAAVVHDWATSAFGTTFIVACVLRRATLIPACFLPTDPDHPGRGRPTDDRRTDPFR